jgi:hypothetical protein
MNPDNDNYVVVIALPADADAAPIHCEDCKWNGRVNDVGRVEDCSLTPGDASPVGRCPKCETLVYLNREIDRARDAAADLLRLARQWLRWMEDNGKDDFSQYAEAKALFARHGFRQATSQHDA